MLTSGVARGLAALFAVYGDLCGAEPLRLSLLLAVAASHELQRWMAAVQGVVKMRSGGGKEGTGPRI